MPAFESAAVDRWDAWTRAVPAEAAGLRAGDRVLSVDGRDVPTWEAFYDRSPAAGAAANWPSWRSGRERARSCASRRTRSGATRWATSALQPLLRPQIMQVNPGTPADRAGFARRRRDSVPWAASAGLRRTRSSSAFARARTRRSGCHRRTRRHASPSCPSCRKGPPARRRIGVSISPYESPADRSDDGPGHSDEREAELGQHPADWPDAAGAVHGRYARAAVDGAGGDCRDVRRGGRPRLDRRSSI